MSQRQRTLSCASGGCSDHTAGGGGGGGDGGSDENEMIFWRSAEVSTSLLPNDKEMCEESSVVPSAKMNMNAMSRVEFSGCEAGVNSHDHHQSHHNRWTRRKRRGHHGSSGFFAMEKLMVVSVCFVVLMALRIGPTLGKFKKNRIKNLCMFLHACQCVSLACFFDAIRIRDHVHTTLHSILSTLHTSS